MVQFFSGRLGAILGAMGLLTIADVAIDFHHYIGDWIDVWKAVTRPIWELLLGWLPFEIPWFVKDYLTMSVITIGMTLRASFYDARNTEETTAELLMDLFLTSESSNVFYKSAIWPYFWCSVIWEAYFEEYASTDVYLVFFESFVYALLIIAASYALIFAGA